MHCVSGYCESFAKILTAIKNAVSSLGQLAIFTYILTLTAVPGPF